MVRGVSVAEKPGILRKETISGTKKVEENDNL